MTILPIINIPDPILRKTSNNIDNIDKKLAKFMNSMAETMYNAEGIGLAAVQVGENIRAITIDCGQIKKGQEPSEEKKKFTETLLFLINPNIVSLGERMSVHEEGCLSIPDYRAEVERPESCIVEYIDINGKQKTIDADGLLATCIQHEIDHLNGKLFIDYLSKIKRDSVIRKFTKIARQENRHKNRHEKSGKL